MGRKGCCFPHLPCSGSRPLYKEHALRCVQFQFSGTPQKPDSVAPAFCAFPGRSSSSSQELDGHTLPGCGAPSPLRGPSLSFRSCMRLVFSCDPPSGCRPSRISGSLWLETGGLFAVLVGDAVSGAEFAPFPSPLPPASGGAGLVHSRLAPLDLLGPFVLQTAGSVFGRLIFSLLLSHNLSYCLTKAPSDCPQGTQARSLP